MKRPLSIAATALSLALTLVLASCSAVATSPTPNPSAAATATPAANGTAVAISGFAFDPGTLTVPVGTTVTWTNDDLAAHTIVFADFQSGSLAKGDTYSHVFAVAGTYAYSCGVHPSMKGTIVVQ